MARTKTNDDTAAADREGRQQQLAEQRERTDADNAEAQARMDAAKPTPTQAENDAARLGALDLDAEKEDHGGEDEQQAVHRQMTARYGGGGYRNKASSDPAA